LASEIFWKVQPQTKRSTFPIRHSSFVIRHSFRPAPIFCLLPSCIFPRTCYPSASGR